MKMTRIILITRATVSVEMENVDESNCENIN
jgi:hypothetical protein